MTMSGIFTRRLKSPRLSVIPIPKRMTDRKMLVYDFAQIPAWGTKYVTTAQTTTTAVNHFVSHDPNCWILDIG